MFQTKRDSSYFNLKVTVPPTRHDILHACDIYEDVAIAYGYNNLVKTEPQTMTVGRQLPINKLSDQAGHFVLWHQCMFCISTVFMNPVNNPYR